MTWFDPAAESKRSASDPFADTMTAAACVPMPAPFVGCYRVVIPAADHHVIGLSRHEASDQRWVAHSPGDDAGERAASLRRFQDREKAVAWRVEREPSGRGTPRREPLPPPITVDEEPIDNIMQPGPDPFDVLCHFQTENIL